MFSKTSKKRIVNKALLKSYHAMYCLVCGSTPCDPAHVKTIGSGGNDVEYNLVPLCRLHHIEQHKVGWFKMMEKYEVVSGKLRAMKWLINKDKRKLERA